MIYFMCILFIGIATLPIDLFGQSNPNTYVFTGVVYDEFSYPIPHTHVIAGGSREGDVTDSLGIFTLHIRKHDVLSFYNISCRDTSIAVSSDQSAFHIHLKRKMYPLREAKIFTWGSTYDEFLKEVESQGESDNLAEDLGLPEQDPDVIPFDQDETRIKSAGFLVASPVSFLYYNLSKREKNNRKAYKLKRDSELIDLFEQTLSAESISGITGLEGNELSEFQLFLNANLSCDYNCSQIELLSEIHQIWEKFRLNR